MAAKISWPVQSQLQFVGATANIHLPYVLKACLANASRNRSAKGLQMRRDFRRQAAYKRLSRRSFIACQRDGTLLLKKGRTAVIAISSRLVAMTIGMIMRNTHPGPPAKMSIAP